jgi:hypothetical protein
MHTAETSVHGPSPFQSEVAVEKLESYKTVGTDRSSAELIRPEANTLRSKTQKLINSLWNNKELSQQWENK